MNKFLVIDKNKNTVLMSNEDFADLLNDFMMVNKGWYKDIKVHRTKQELYNEVKEYLKQ